MHACVCRIWMCSIHGCHPRWWPLSERSSRRFRYSLYQYWSHHRSRFPSWQLRFSTTTCWWILKSWCSFNWQVAIIFRSQNYKDEIWLLSPFASCSLKKHQHDEFRCSLFTDDKGTDSFVRILSSRQKKTDIFIKYKKSICLKLVMLL